MKTPKVRQLIKKIAQDPNLKFTKKILAANKNSQIYLVGGMVRDLFLSKDSKDYDLVVIGVQPKKLFDILNKFGFVNLVGKTFGVYKFRPDQKFNEMDIALPRTEHSFGTGGYRDVEVTSDYRLPIEKDLERRDFTINAMALDIKFPISNFQFPMKESLRDSFLIDPFGGMKDLKNKLIRAVGDPEERFKEDYSRMLRALRFSVQLGFEIEKNTWQAILKNIKNINNLKVQNSKLKATTQIRKTSFTSLSPSGREAGGEGDYVVPREIIAKELLKMFACDPVKSLEILDKSGMLKLLMPELLKMKKCPQPEQFHAEGDVWEHTLLALKILSSKSLAREFSIFSFPLSIKESSRGNILKIKNSKLKIDPKFENKNLKFIPAELVWAVLFHDLGKPYTIKYEDRIRFNEHDTKSAKLFSEIADRLRLSSAGLDVEKTNTLIAKHMLLTYSKTNEMKETTIEKYFYNPSFPGRELLMLSFADISATIPPSGKPDFSSYKSMKKRIENLRKKMKAKINLPKDLIDGNEIMKILKIPPGKKIGEIKEYLRELQLQRKVKTKQEAEKAITKKFGK